MSRTGGGPAPTHQPTAASSKKANERNMRYMFLAMAVSIALLLSAVATYAAFSDNNGSKGESKYITAKQYQAVFLNNGQVYFGKIKSMDSKIVILDDVFYIEAQNATNTTAASNNYTLRKLGTSELHSPEDRMVISRDQVTFWENIKDTGRVVTAIKQYKQNPNAANQVQSQSDTGAQTPTANQNTSTKKTAP